MEQYNQQLLRLHNISGIGDQTLVKLFQITNDPGEILREIKNGHFFGIRKSMKYELPDDEKIERQTSYCLKNQIQLVPYSDVRYPQNLRELTDPPALLYCRGSLDLLLQKSISVVGTRNYSNYGKAVCEAILPMLTRLNLPVVSGLALGIDALAHEVTIQNRGKAIAILGSGIDIIAPISNLRLAENILHTNGLIFSEFPLETRPTHYTFPQRNRLIAAISEGTLVVEAGEKSGSLMTADFALDLGKEVYAVPGSIFSPMSQGTNQMISRGAKIITKAEEILEDWGVSVNPIAEVLTFESSEEQLIYEALNNDPIFIDDLIEKVDLPIANILTYVSSLELKGYIRRLEGDYLSRKRF